MVHSLLSCPLTTTVVLGAKCFWAVRKMWWYAEHTTLAAQYLDSLFMFHIHVCRQERPVWPVCQFVQIVSSMFGLVIFISMSIQGEWQRDKTFFVFLGGAVRNSPERTMFFSSFWAELAELPTDVWLFPGISLACTSLDSHHLLVQSWSTLEQHWNCP